MQGLTSADGNAFAFALWDDIEQFRGSEPILEFTLKDISTCRYRPQRLWEWCDIAARMVCA